MTFTPKPEERTACMKMRWLLLLVTILTACAPPSLALAYSPEAPAAPVATCVQLDGATEIGDLNGDGKAEVSVSYQETPDFPGAPTFNYLMIAEVDGDCLRPVYTNEQGHDSVLLETLSQDGWDSIVLFFNAGDVTLKILADHDGQSYRWSNMIDCSGSADACRDAFRSFAP